MSSYNLNGKSILTDQMIKYTRYRVDSAIINWYTRILSLYGIVLCNSNSISYYAVTHPAVVDFFGRRNYYEANHGFIRYPVSRSAKHCFIGFFLRVR